MKRSADTTLNAEAARPCPAAAISTRRYNEHGARDLVRGEFDTNKG
jgi:hypothetical protein